MESYDVAVVGMGALGSAAAYQLARRGARVVAFEQYELGHVRGASHDTSRIVRTSYGEERYVRLAQSAYRDWADLSQQAGERFVVPTGGIVMIRSGGPYSATSFATSLAAAGVAFELLDPGQVRARWPQFAVPDGVETVYTADSGMVHASRAVAALQMLAVRHGADVRERTPVLAVEPGGSGVVVRHGGSGGAAPGEVRARRVVLATDAWVNQLLEPLGAAIPLRVMQEQVTYFRPADPERFDRSRFPVWIWEDDECYYGFPTFGEPTVKAARDVSENLMTPAERTFEASRELLDQLRGFVGGLLPGAGEVLRTVTCQYALTPDREFVLDALPDHPGVLVALTAGHGFKFTPAVGRVLAELTLDGGSTDDISGFRVPAPAPA